MTLETTRRGLEDLLLPAGTVATPIRLIASQNDAALQGLSSPERAWVEAQGWSAKQGSVLLLPNGQGEVGGILLGTGGKDWATQAPLLPGVLPAALPPGDYRFASPLPDPELTALAFLAGNYRFTRYKTDNGPKPKRLVLPEGATRPEIGQKIECETPHCDPTVNLYDHYHLVRGDTLVDIWPVDARGKR